VKYLKGIKGFSSKKVTWLTALLKCHYTNACSMGSRREELEAIMQLAIYDQVLLTETWWNEFCDWRAAIDGYRLFRSDRQGRRCRGIAL